MKKEILRVENVNSSCNSSAYLMDFRMTLYEGEITGITGLVDSGITRVADVLSGRNTIESGKVYLFNQPVEIRSLETARRLGIHVISQRPVFFEHLTLEENICIAEKDFLSSLHFPSSKQIRKIVRCVDELEISIDLKVPASELSTAGKYMVEMLRAYYNCASLIIINQIVGSCTEDEFRQISEMIFRLRARGMGSIVLDTNFERIRDVSDVLLVMRGGRVEGIYKQEEISKKIVEQTSLGDYRIPNMQKKEFDKDKKCPLLEVDNIEIEGIGRFNFRLNKGEIIGFWDEHGNLSELLYEILCGNSIEKKEYANLEGKQISLSGGRTEMIRQGFGYIDNYHRGVFPRLSVRKNLTLVSLKRLSHRMTINHKLEKVVAIDMAKELDISLEDLNKPIEKVSMSTRFLITIYRWILRKSKVLIFHNALAGSDIIMRNSMLKIINLIHESDMGSIIFSVDLKELYELCDYVYVLK